MSTLNEVLSGKAWRTLPFTAGDQLTPIHTTDTGARQRRSTVTANRGSQQTETENDKRADGKYDVFLSFNLKPIDLTALLIFFMVKAFIILP